MIPAKLNWTPKIMESKIIVLEESLNYKKEILLEKEIVFDELLKMIEQIQEKVNASKQENLEKAINLNQMKTKFRDIVQKMMSIVSEVSVYQANGLKLEQVFQFQSARLEYISSKMLIIFGEEVEQRVNSHDRSKDNSLPLSESSGRSIIF